jgi:phosphonoacetaldehyde hydrolase
MSGPRALIETVIFDWAGTTVDQGSLAPVRAITKLFAHHGIRLGDEDARRDMGIYKKDHIRRILGMPHVSNQWSDAHGSLPEEKDVERLFTEFIPLQSEVLARHSHIIGGVAETAERLRSRGLKIGATTGYTRPMLDILLACAAEEGYHPDLSLCPDDVGAGRPFPWMCLRIALEFRIGATSAAVKVGDTVSDIQEGLNAGMWTVGVTATGNEIGLSASDLEALPSHERKLLLEKAEDTLKRAGAHYVISSVAAVEPVLDQIESRLAAGARP